jgi:hypothetical protein
MAGLYAIVGVRRVLQCDPSTTPQTPALTTITPRIRKSIDCATRLTLLDRRVTPLFYMELVASISSRLPKTAWHAFAQPMDRGAIGYTKDPICSNRFRPKNALCCLCTKAGGILQSGKAVTIRRSGKRPVISH